jgi:formamidopyrimidine-DNA glycosylase
MPELAEVEYFRKQWNPGLGGKILEALVHPHSRVFRGVDVKQLVRALTGRVLQSSTARGKQMLFRVKPDIWLGLHLGMTGELQLEEKSYRPQKHDHLVLRQAQRCCVFSDARHFGRVLFYEGKEAPKWWSKLPPDILSSKFTVTALRDFLRRRPKPPIKAVLLMQERFPGVGNWMADEILWRAGIHPRVPAGRLTPLQIRILWKEIRRVCELALDIIGKDWSDIPDNWLFNHRWSRKGLCPRTHVPLVREIIGGRTTCWSPGRQRPPVYRKVKAREKKSR